MSAWNRNRLAVVVLALATVPVIALGDDDPKAEKPPAAKPTTAFDPIELHASPPVRPPSRRWGIGSSRWNRSETPETRLRSISGTASG